MRKSLTLLPAGVLAAAIIGSACAPPPPRRPRRPRRHAARLDRLRGPELGQGRPRQRRSHRLVGRRRHRRGHGRHRQRRLRRRHLQQRRVPDRPDRGARQPGGVLPGRRQRAEHVQRQLRWRPGQRPGHRRHEPVRGRQLHHPQRRAPSNRLVKLNACRRARHRLRPAAHPGSGRGRRHASHRTASWPSPTPRDRRALRRWRLRQDRHRCRHGPVHAGRQRGRLHAPTAR